MSLSHKKQRVKKIAEDLITEVGDILKSVFFFLFFFPRVVTVILNLVQANLIAFSADHFREPEIRPVLQICCVNTTRAWKIVYFWSYRKQDAPALNVSVEEDVNCLLEGGAFSFFFFLID